MQHFFTIVNKNYLTIFILLIVFITIIIYNLKHRLHLNIFQPIIVYIQYII